MGTAATVFCKVWSKRPTLLKRVGNASSVDTTLNWNLIMSVITQCMGLAGGVFIAMNVSLFVLFGVWHIDPKSIGLLVVAFIILMLRSFDRFLTNLMRVVH
ncbi:hypothetical protein [Candidatus Nitrososphaera sp. FF02]|uniref:hypothetical protein n=1 Tax=Candidatus Nitrososphaera sp. FF02 TaxID=3398226 RepID=UPI0039EC19DF